MSDISLRLKLSEDASSKLKKIAENAKTAASNVSSAGKEMDKAFSSTAPDTFSSKAGKAIESVMDDAESLGSAIDEAVGSFESISVAKLDSMESVFSESATSAEDMAKSASKVAEGLGDVAKETEGLGEGLEDIGSGAGGLDDVGDSADGAGKSMGDSAGKALTLQDALKKLFAVAAGAKVLEEIKDFTADSINLGRDYTSMMSEVQAISGASASEIAQLEEVAREYGATTVFSASEAAEALKYMSLAGWDVNQSTSALGGVLNLAAASGMGLGQASDMVTDYLSAFGMEASQATYFADMLSYAQSHSNTTAEQLGEAYKNSAANLHAAGQDVETTTSLLEAMANQGYKGSEAGTALAATMRDITQNMDEGAIKIGDTAVAVQDSEGNFRDLTDILYDVESATAGMGDAEKAAALSSTFTSDSIKALNMILAEGMDKVSGYEEELRKAGGTSEEMAGIMNDNLNGDLAEMDSAMEEMKLQVYEGMEEPLRDMVQYVSGDLIPILTDWVPQAFSSAVGGVSKIGTALKPLIETVLKNPQAIGSAFASIGTGLVAMKTVSAGMSIADKVKDAGGMVAMLKGFGTTLVSNPWAAGAAAVVAAVTAVGFAIHAYNEQQIDNSLAEHFGDIELTAAQIESVAGHILNAKYLVNIQGALNEFENADKLAEEAEAALAENDALEWKASIGMTWDESEVTEYITNIDEFINASVQELESRTYAATITVKTMLGGTEEGETLASQMEQWAIEDELEMENLSAQLKSAVEQAMIDGVLDANEQAAITILQSKMNSILNSWKESDAQAQMSLINQKYGTLSGKELTDGTFTKLVEELTEQREEAEIALDESYTQLMSTLHGLNNSGRLDEAGVSFENLEKQAGFAYRNATASGLANAVNFEKNTLSDTYGELLQTNYAQMENDTKTFITNASKMFSSGDIVGTFDQLFYGGSAAQTYSGLFSSSDQKALADIYEVMKPDVSAMQSLMSEYREAGQAIPQELMTSFNEAMLVGAAAGDASAAWQVFANQMVADPANNALVQAIQDGTQSAPQELKEALEIALAETTSEPLTMDEVAVSLAGFDLDVSQIAELTGMTEEEVQAALDKMGVETEVDVTTTAGEVDASGAVEAGAQAEAAAQSEAGGDTTVDKTVTANTTYVEGTTDTSQVDAAAQEQLESGSATQEVVTNTTYVPGTTDVSQVTSATETALADQTVNGTATANVTASCGTDNFAATAAEFATKFQSALTTAFNKTFSATTNASITVNYSIANPSKTITFSGGGTGTATVYAHASGGIFEVPHYGLVAEAGPEAIIPLDGSANAFDLWQEAGERLGVLQGDQPISVAPATMSGPSENGKGEKSSTRTIDININGSGSISAGGGMSKDDVIAILMERAREVISDIVEQDILMEGDGVYEY